jgi:hypothetical protein
MLFGCEKKVKNMCKFASFILTKSNEYFLDTSDSHEDIIEHFHLDDDEISIVRVELIPPSNREDILDENKWEFNVDQDEYPDWTYSGDPTLEEKARKALVRRIEEQKIGETVIVGDYDNAIGNNYSTVKSGKYGLSIGKDHAKAISGESGVSIVESNGSIEAGYGGYGIAWDNNEIQIAEAGCCLAGNDNIIKSHYDCKVSVGCRNTIEVGYCSEVFANERNTITVGVNSKVFAGKCSKIKAGDNSVICIYYTDRDGENKVISGFVGNDGLEPDVFYVEHNGIFMKEEE